MSGIRNWPYPNRDMCCKYCYPEGYESTWYFQHCGATVHSDLVVEKGTTNFTAARITLDAAPIQALCDLWNGTLLSVLGEITIPPNGILTGSNATNRKLSGFEQLEVALTGSTTLTGTVVELDGGEPVGDPEDISQLVTLTVARLTYLANCRGNRSARSAWLATSGGPISGARAIINASTALYQNQNPSPGGSIQYENPPCMNATIESLTNVNTADGNWGGGTATQGTIGTSTTNAGDFAFSLPVKLTYLKFSESSLLDCILPVSPPPPAP